MKRRAAAVAMAGLLVGLLPSVASAGKKRNPARPRGEATSTRPHTSGRALDLGSDALSRGVMDHARTVEPPPAARPQPQPRQRATAAQRQAPRQQRPPMHAPARGGLGRAGMTALKIAGVGAVSVVMGGLMAAGFAGIGATIPLAAVIGIPAVLILTGAVALISHESGPSIYNQSGDPRNVLRAAAFQQQRRRQQQMGSNFPTAGPF